MTEVKTYIYENEIQMLQAFMKGECSLDQLALEWDDELLSLLTSLGNIVTDPNFIKETYKQMFTGSEEKKPITGKTSTVLCLACDTEHTITGESFKYFVCPECRKTISKHSQDLEERMREIKKP